MAKQLGGLHVAAVRISLLVTYLKAVEAVPAAMAAESAAKLREVATRMAAMAAGVCVGW